MSTIVRHSNDKRFTLLKNLKKKIIDYVIRTGGIFETPCELLKILTFFSDL